MTPSRSCAGAERRRCALGCATQDKGPAAHSDVGAREVRLHDDVLAPPRERDATLELRPAAACASQVGPASVLLGELGGEVGDVQELLVGAGALGRRHIERAHARAGDEMRLRKR